MASLFGLGKDFLLTKSITDVCESAITLRKKSSVLVFGTLQNGVDICFYYLLTHKKLTPVKVTSFESIDLNQPQNQGQELHQDQDSPSPQILDNNLPLDDDRLQRNFLGDSSENKIFVMYVDLYRQSLQNTGFEMDVLSRMFSYTSLTIKPPSLEEVCVVIERGFELLGVVGASKRDAKEIALEIPRDLNLIQNVFEDLKRENYSLLSIEMVYEKFKKHRAGL